jgi:hypothetical protein
LVDFETSIVHARGAPPVSDFSPPPHALARFGGVRASDGLTDAPLPGHLHLAADALSRAVASAALIAAPVVPVEITSVGTDLLSPIVVLGLAIVSPSAAAA